MKPVMVTFDPLQLDMIDAALRIAEDQMGRATFWAKAAAYRRLRETLMNARAAEIDISGLNLD